MCKVNIKIEGKDYQVEEGMTILEAARYCSYEIPSLCSFNHGECSPGLLPRLPRGGQGRARSSPPASIP